VSFEDLLKSLQLDYLNALPAKISLITSQIDSGDVAEIRESFHKLKGTGRTYGMPEVSELSAAVEKLCLQGSAENALGAARHAVTVLSAIHASRLRNEEHPLAQDGSYLEIQKLLQT
jgi:HPt (histidine-containing phosphotransfer) domain-containing protein